MSYVLALDLLERQWHTATLGAAVMRSQGGDAPMDTWVEVQDRFDEWLTSEPLPPDAESEKLRLLGLK